MAKEEVIALVKAAGKVGIRVKQIAGELGVDAQRIYSWFNSTGKKVKGIERSTFVIDGRAPN